jgi:hypothetical protein
MANAIDLTSSWNSTYFAEIVLIPAIMTDGLFAGGYDIDLTVNKSKTFYTGNQLRNKTFKKLTCGFQANGTTDLTEVTLVTQPMAINLEQCASEFFDSVFKQNLQKGTNVYDIGGTVIEEFILASTLEMVKNDSFALAWFGNASLSSTSFLSPFNGWFELFEGDADVTKISIGSTGSFAITAMQSAFESAAGQLARQQGNAKFHVTPNVYYNLLATFENSNTDYGLTKLSEGGELRYRGIPVVEEMYWATVISEQGLSNTKRIFLGDTQKLIVGTNIANPGSDSKSWIDELTELYYFKAYYDLGVTYSYGNTFVYGRG